MMPRTAWLLLVAVACGGGEPTGGSTDPKGTDPDPTETDTDTDTVDTETTTTDTGPTDEVVFTPSEALPKGMPAVLTGVRVDCESDTEARVTAEFFGEIGTVEAAPIVDGVLLPSASLPIEERSLFHLASASVSVADCQATGWRIVAAANGRETCLVTGSGASEWLDGAAGDCQLR